MEEVYFMKIMFAFSNVSANANKDATLYQAQILKSRIHSDICLTCNLMAFEWITALLQRDDYISANATQWSQKNKVFLPQRPCLVCREIHLR